MERPKKRRALSRKTKIYKKTHTTQEALNAHVAKLSERQGGHKITGLTVEYYFWIPNGKSFMQKDLEAIRKKKNSTK